MTQYTVITVWIYKPRDNLVYNYNVMPFMIIVELGK